MALQHPFKLLLLCMTAAVLAVAIDVRVVKIGGPLLEDKPASLSAIPNSHDGADEAAFSTGASSLDASDRAPVELQRLTLSKANMSNVSKCSELNSRQTLNPNAIPFFVPTGNWRIPGNVKIVTPTIELKTLLTDSLVELFQLVLAALGNIGSPGSESSSFRRYFKPEDRCVVQAVFQAILGPNNLGPDDMNWYTIYWNQIDPTDTTQTLSCSIPLLQAFCNADLPATTTDPESKRAYMTVCPRSNWASLKPSFCDLILDPLHPRLGGLKFTPIARAMLHEFTHWQRVIGHLSGGELGDFNVQTHIPNINPPNGYGAYNAMLLNRNGFDPTKNADNYAWFAVESYLLKSDICGARKGWTDFEDPVVN